ncbi:hypothetical protein lerEdw1_007245 [Lerista edwardsae]|nr:hypothetical protein lerEdw1_007245 [Lerista edwardsae]
MVVFLGRHLPSLLALFKKKVEPRAGPFILCLSLQGLRRPRTGSGRESSARLGMSTRTMSSSPAAAPPHVEELHLQAQAGLRSWQNQESQKQSKWAWDHRDAGSVQSSCSSTEGDDLSIRSQTPLCSPETASEDTLSIRSEMIQRKGSTFRPHDLFPKGEKRRRERRTTILGLPQHVQEELGMSNGRGSKKRPGSIAPRAGQPAQPFPNGARMPGRPVHIPTLDGKPQATALPEGGARVSLQVLEAEGSEAALQHHIRRVYYDDSLLGRRTAAKLSPLARPKSLAVPWLTTQAASPELLRPVLSISPQGTYLSKIIPNAIMPPTVDVIALSRDRVRTLSRCSLATASPASLRSVGRFPSVPGSREHSSSSDNWSHSQSTETIVSNASTISSQGGGGRRSEAGPGSQPHAAPRPGPAQLSSFGFASSDGIHGKAAPASPSLLEVRPPGGSGGRASPAYSSSSVADGSDSMSVRSDRSSARSPERRPPRESSEAWAPVPLGSPGLAGADEVFPPAPPSGTSSPGLDGLASTASPAQGRPALTLDQLSSGRPQEQSSRQGSPVHSGRTLSPSSGYSSQSGTPTLHARGLAGQAVSPGRKRPQPQKPERGSSLQSPGLSVSSSLTSLSSSASDPAPAEGLALPPSGAPSLEASGAGALLIPPHPKKPDVSPETPLPVASEPDPPADALWPPPPPPLPEEQDLSMADFPPPEEACLSALPPLEPQSLAAAGPPPSPATGAPSAPEQLASQRAAPAEEGCGPPSFSSRVSSKLQQRGAPEAPRGELPLPAPLGDGQQAAAPAAPLPPGLPAPASLKRPVASGPRPDQRKEPAPRSKSGSVPKEDASLPIVTPSLLQMVRLRSVHLDSHGPALSPAAARPPAEQNGPSPAGSERQGQPAPQKPVRKALSLRVPPSASHGAGPPANPLHQAVRLKAAALSSPASTASFIFAKSPKKLVIETPSSPDAQASLQRSLVAELMTISGQRAPAALGPKQPPPQQGAVKAPKKPPKVPPPIAKKPSLASSSPLLSPQSPKPPGAGEPSSSLPAAGDRTGHEAPAAGKPSAGGVDSDSPPAGLEAPTAPVADLGLEGEGLEQGQQQGQGELGCVPDPLQGPPTTAVGSALLLAGTLEETA